MSESELDRAAKQIGGDFQALAEGLLEDVLKIARSMPPEGLNAIPEHMRNNPFSLIYHLLGSARYWIGEVVGGQPTHRVRAEEFGRTGTLEELEERLRDARERLARTFANLRARDLFCRPLDLSRGVLCWGDVPPEGRTSVWVIAHDLAHIAYTLGQLERIKLLWDAKHAESG